MEIRTVQKKDFKACVEIYNYYIENTSVTFEERKLSAGEFAKRGKRILKRYPFLVASNEGKILGFAYLDRFHERSAYRYTADFSVYLDGRYKGLGVGAKLLEKIEDEGRKSGIKKIISLVVSDNLPSVKFHLKHGFSECGEMQNVGFKFNKWHSIKYFQKDI